MKQNSLILIAIACIVVVAAAAFLLTQPQAQTPADKEKVVFMVPFIAQPQWMAYYTAEGKGFYDDEGLDVEIQYSTKGSAGPVEQLVGGKVDFVLTDAESIVISQSKGIDIIATYPIEPTDLFYVISKQKLTTPQDLAGKTVGVISTASGSYPNLQVILNEAGLTVDNVEVVAAGTALVTSFLEDKFDAAGVHLSQKLLIEQQATGLSVINAADYTNMSSGHITITRQYAQDNPETVRKFLRATKKGIEYAVAHPEESVGIYVAFNPDADKEASLSAWKAFIEEFNYNQSLPTTETQEHWNEVQDSVYEIGMVASKTDATGFYDNSFAP